MTARCHVCRRRLRRPSRDGLGPVCRRRLQPQPAPAPGLLETHAYDPEALEAAGQLAIDTEEAA